MRGAYGSAGDSSPVGLKSAAAANNNAATGAAFKYTGGLMASAQIGVRFDKFVSGGLYGTLGRSGTEIPASAAPTNRDLTRSSWGAGLYVRAYPLARVPGLSKHLDPWVSVGVGYLSDNQTYTLSTATTAGTDIDATVRVNHHGVAVPLSLGVDYRALPSLSVGPYVEYSIVNGVAGCTALSAPGVTGSSMCSNTAPGDQILDAKNYGVFSGGLNLKFTPL